MKQVALTLILICITLLGYSQAWTRLNIIDENGDLGKRIEQCYNPCQQTVEYFEVNQIARNRMDINNNITAISGLRTLTVTTKDDLDSLLLEVQEVREIVDPCCSLRKISFPIGEWDMDKDQVLNVPHGLSNYKDIRSVEVVISDDAGINIFPLNFMNTVTGNIDGGVNFFNTVNVVITRLNDGSFDSISFDDVGFNRGFITIEFEI